MIIGEIYNIFQEGPGVFNLWRIFLFYYYYFFYSHVHTLFMSFLPLSPSPTLSPLPPSVPGRSRSAFITSFVEEKRQA
jgi:hypothetical protein